MSEESSKLRVLVLLVVAVAVCWALAASVLDDRLLVPPPTSVFVAVIGLLGNGTFWSNLSVSCAKLAGGMLVALGASCVLEATSRGRPEWRKVLQSGSSMLGAVPAVALFPLFVILFGIGAVSHVAMIIAMAIFPMLDVLLKDGLPERRSYIAFSRGPVRATGQFDVTSAAGAAPPLPRAVPALQAGMPFAITALIVGEFIASTSGVGYMLISAATNFDVNTYWATFLLLAVAAALLFGTLKAAERR